MYVSMFMCVVLAKKKKKSLCGEYIGVQVVFNNIKLTQSEGLKSYVQSE